MPILTQQKSVPWSWVFWMCVPWAASVYIEQMSGTALTFTLRRYVENPVLISFISSINIAFNFMVGSVASYLSDRIWTRWGRRKPFLIVGRVLTGLCLLSIPFIENYWILLVVIVIYQFTNDVGTPYEPLYNEVIPAHQRGRASIIRNILQSLTMVFFSMVLIARFDQHFSVGTWNFRGEHLIYWTGGVIALCVAAFLAFGVNEMHNETTATSGISFRKFFKDIFGTHQARMLFLLYACPALAGGGLGALLPLLQTEQLGLSKAEVGSAMAIMVGINMLLFFPLGGFLADRVSRLKLFRLGIMGPPCVHLLFWIYLRFIANYEIGFGGWMTYAIISGFFLALLVTVWGPLVYDYIPNGSYGTFSAGFGLVAGVVGFLLINASGLWVETFTKIVGVSGQGKFDYTSAFIPTFFLGLIALGITYWFEREVRAGLVHAYGKSQITEKTEVLKS